MRFSGKAYLVITVLFLILPLSGCTPCFSTEKYLESIYGNGFRKTDGTYYFDKIHYSIDENNNPIKRVAHSSPIEVPEEDRIFYEGNELILTSSKDTYIQEETVEITIYNNTDTTIACDDLNILDVNLDGTWYCLNLDQFVVSGQLWIGPREYSTYHIDSDAFGANEVIPVEGDDAIMIHKIEVPLCKGLYRSIVSARLNIDNDPCPSLFYVEFEIV